LEETGNIDAQKGSIQTIPSIPCSVLRGGIRNEEEGAAGACMRDKHTLGAQR